MQGHISRALEREQMAKKMRLGWGEKRNLESRSKPDRSPCGLKTTRQYD